MQSGWSRLLLASAPSYWHHAHDSSGELDRAAALTPAGHLTCCKLLLDEGADIEQRNVVRLCDRGRCHAQKAARMGKACYSALPGVICTGACDAAGWQPQQATLH